MLNKNGYISLFAAIILSGFFAFAYLVIWNVKFSQVNLNRAIIAMDNFTNSIVFDYDENEIKDGKIMLSPHSINDVSDKSLEILKVGLFLDDNFYVTERSPIKEAPTVNLNQSSEGEIGVEINTLLSVRSLIPNLYPSVNYNSKNSIYFDPKIEEMKTITNTGDLHEENGKFYLLKVPNPYLGEFVSVQWPYDQEEIFKANTNISTAFDAPTGEYTSVSGLFTFKKQKIYEGTQEDLKMISVGESHSLGIKQDDTLVGWGSNDDGRLEIPISLTDGTVSVENVSSGKNHSLAVDSLGNLYAWGDDSFLQIQIPSGTSNILKGKAGENFSVALTNDGVVSAWGHNSFGQCNVPIDLVDVVDISAGKNHVLALKGDGTVVAWGDNSQGQTDIPSDVEVSEIYAGNNFSLIKKTNGDLVSYGSNDDIIPIPEDQFIEKIIVSPFASHAMLIMQDGSYVAWGNNDYSQTEVPETLVPTDGYVGNGFSIIETNDGLYAFGLGEDDQLNIPNFIRHVPNDFTIESNYYEEDGMWKNEVYIPENVENRFIYLDIKMEGDSIDLRFPNETDSIYIGSIGLNIEKYLVTSKER